MHLMYTLALVVGVLAGLRSMAAPAAVSWAAHLGWLNLGGTWLAFLGHRFTPWILTALALGELVVDQLPWTPSRTVTPLFVGRVLSGALCGAALGVPAGSWVVGLMFGAGGAVIGTLLGAEARRRLAEVFQRDRPAALIEDAATVGSLAAIVGGLA